MKKCLHAQPLADRINLPDPLQAEKEGIMFIRSNEERVERNERTKN